MVDQITLVEMQRLAVENSEVEKGDGSCLGMANAGWNVGPVCLGISLGVQLMLGGLVLFGPIRNPTGLGRLTRRALVLSHPEHDLGIFVGGIVVSALLCGGLWIGWRRVLRGSWWPSVMERILPQDDAQFAGYSGAVQLVLAAVSLLAFMLVLCTRFGLGPDGLRASPGAMGWMLLAMPGAAALVCAALDLRFGFQRSSSDEEVPTARFDLARRRAGLALDVLVPLLILLAVSSRPAAWANMAGDFLVQDQVHSWNYFAMGPALAFKGGAALGTDTYSQYGMGWPITFAMLDRIVRLSYANMIGLGIVYGCIYYIASYFFLRYLTRSAPWAAAGVIVAIMLQLFSGTAPGWLNWQFPSSTMLRHPADVWFFFAILLHQRTRNDCWIIVAGVFTGLAMFFELDTGMYLPMVFALYWFLDGRRSARARILPLVFGVAAMAALLIGLAIGSRGTLLHGAFWYGYLEGLRTQAFSGFGFLPVAGVDDYGILLFALMVLTYFLAVAIGIIAARSREGSEWGMMTACLGAYGLAMLLLFVGRSDPSNLYHPAVPFAVVVTVMLHRGVGALGRWVRWTSLPWLAVVVCAALLLSKPEFLLYPSLAKSIFVKLPEGRIALSDSTSDLALPAELGGGASVIKELASSMRKLSASGEGVVVIDDLDTPLYLLSGVRPWSRYTTLIPSMLTLDLLEQSEKELLERNPRYVVIRNPSTVSENWSYADIFKAFYRLLPDHYILDRRIGGYEIWRLPRALAE